MHVAMQLFGAHGRVVGMNLSCSEQQPGPQWNPRGPLLRICEGSGLVIVAEVLVDGGCTGPFCRNERVGPPQDWSRGAPCTGEFGPGGKAVLLALQNGMFV